MLYYGCRYIYIPLGGSRQGIIRQMLASFCSFAFIWQWHGGHLQTLWWFIPNWFGVVVESIAGIVLAQPSVKRLEVGVFVRKKQQCNIGGCLHEGRKILPLGRS